MKDKKFSFSILEELEKKKIQKEIINIQNFYLNDKKNKEQLKLLTNYHREYQENLHNKMILGICIHEWKNYSDFISILNVIILDNKKKIKSSKTIIKKSLETLSECQKKLKIWTNLHAIRKKQILKTEKIKEQTLNDMNVQLKFFNKG